MSKCDQLHRLVLAKLQDQIAATDIESTLEDSLVLLLLTSLYMVNVEE